ncbi:hypothetical protein KC967_00530 [Candidatus Saccharibacteria bacterium]|nr:hypothetical protein [Candidatus Saccharibacteria bacterium]
MKIHQAKTNRKRNVVAVVILALVLLAGMIAWACHYQQWPFAPPVAQDKPVNTVDYTAPTKQQAETGTATKERVAEQAKQQESQEGSTTPSGTIPVNITAVQPGETVYIRTLISSVTSSATCKLDMAGPDGKTYASSVGTQALAGSSTCQGFNIPMSELSSGSWKITITVADGTNVGTVTTEKTL